MSQNYKTYSRNVPLTLCWPHWFVCTASEPSGAAGAKKILTEKFTFDYLFIDKPTCYPDHQHQVCAHHPLC